MVVGIVMSGFGLSAFFFSSISHILFPGNTSDFLLTLALGTSLPMVWGFFFVRPIPLPPSEITHTLERGAAEHYSPLAASEPANVFLRANNSETQLLFTSDEEDGESEEDAAAPAHPKPPRRHHDRLRTPMNDSVELSPSASLEGFQNRSRSRSLSVTPAVERITLEKNVDGRGVDLSAWALWKSGDFWLMLAINILRKLFLRDLYI